MKRQGNRKKGCVWKQDEIHGHWDTSCDNAFMLDTGTPKENGMNYCPYCGKVLIGAALKKRRGK